MAPQDISDGAPLQSWLENRITGMSLDAAGLVALADLKIIEERTALTGSSTYLDTFVLCPGMHRQQHATGLNFSEFPAVAALTSGYVFRVENPATVFFLQKIGKTGHLVNAEVLQVSSTKSVLTQFRSAWWSPNPSFASSTSYLATVSLTMLAIGFMILIGDWWALAFLTTLMLSRSCNIVIVRRRSQVGWKGAPEPGVKGDLLVLLSQDRWIRMKGNVDDLKAVLSGQWMRDMTFTERSMAAIATMLVYIDAALASNAQQTGKIVLMVLLLVSAGLLSFSNDQIKTLQMFSHSIRAVGPAKAYKRRRDLADELIKETGREDWAVRLGMINTGSGSKTDQGVQVMM
ncbi:hypothetical protein MMC26_004094 [Xylographa opegraphella]|nr:hypothetical protein [Xylographa opegraphella]